MANREGIVSQTCGMIILLAAALAALFLSGCPALMIPSLGYEAYKYEHNKSSQTPQSSATAVPPPGMTE